MKYAIALAILMVTIGCSEEAVENNNQKEEKQPIIENTEKIDSTAFEEVILVDSSIVDTTYANLVASPMYFLPEEVEILLRYFTDSTIVVYDSCQVLLVEAKTDTAFEYAYLKLLAIRKVLVDQIYAANFYEQTDRGYYPDFLLEEFKVIDEAAIGVHSDCVAECTEFDFTINIEELRPLVLSTKGENDDLLFEIFELADGDYGGTGMGWHNWLERTWDYGGGTLFGSGLHLRVLLKINDLKIKSPNYNDLMRRYQDDLLWDIRHGIYMKTREETILELKEIVALDFLTEEEKAPLNKLLTDWETGVDECKRCMGGKYQFDCQSNDCDWGG